MGFGLGLFGLVISWTRVSWVRVRVRVCARIYRLPFLHAGDVDLSYQIGNQKMIKFNEMKKEDTKVRYEKEEKTKTEATTTATGRT